MNNLLMVCLLLLLRLALPILALLAGGELIRRRQLYLRRSRGIQ